MEKKEQHQEVKVYEVPRLMIEKDFSTGEFIVWDTQEGKELFRGTREEAQHFRFTEED